ncbi:pyruvate kinase [Acetobacter estunensis NRIC 0472]|uniref:Pyruvate kinase n=1 Tax=Acetobacter estunensis TaxID=104097 RepID=A0A967EBV0_9PROT|nr:pyruvate kinase [Acetobacter estunensis]NHO53888.1 pyruvate kinase [Acetobacter estunensis]GBQ24428.1 pyruvate kinase [Acetobacter estunensis NRIC 0472]
MTAAQCRTKIVATLGPSSSDHATILALATAGADVFRFNFSHGTQAEHAARYRIVRQVEAEVGRPLGVLADMQGPKLRVGHFADGHITLETGAPFRLDLDETPGTTKRVQLPHPEIIAAAHPGSVLLLDDGKLRLKVTTVGRDFLETEVQVGGPLSDHKGVNVPDLMLPIPALTPRDRENLAFALELGADFIALSFIQKAEDVLEARELVKGRAWIVSKLEKPQAMENLDAILAASDAVMVARGDLGVELPPEAVPLAQKRITRAARKLGKPVIVATQMLESMITAPTPTRAEASDVATAVFDGADAVMLSAESAAGAYPREAVTVMNRILERVEADAGWRALMQAARLEPEHHVADAIAGAAQLVANTLDASTIVAYTHAGPTALRIARERPIAAILGLTPTLTTARRLTLVWGVHPCVPDPAHHAHDTESMVSTAVETGRTSGLARAGDTMVIIAGVPFGVSGSTNTLRVAKVPDSV